MLTRKNVTALLYSISVFCLTAALWGCSGGNEGVRNNELPEGVVSDETVEGVMSENMELDQVLGSIEELSMLQLGEGPWTAPHTVEALRRGGPLSLVPGAREEGHTLEIGYYPGGRLRSVRSVIELPPDGGLQSIEEQHFFTFTSEGGTTGDLNDTPPFDPEDETTFAAVVQDAVSVLAVHNMPLPDYGFTDVEVVTTGDLTLYEDPEAFWMEYEYTTTGFPAQAEGYCDEPSVVRVERSGSMSILTLTSEADEEVIFSDGQRSAYRMEATFDPVEGWRAGVWTRSGPDALSVEGSFTFENEGTPACPLDDTGTYTALVNFPVEEGAGVVAPRSELITATVAGALTEFDFVLTFEDGTEIERASNVERLYPASCEDVVPGTLGAAIFQVDGTTYQGSEYSIRTTITGFTALSDGRLDRSNGTFQTFTRVNHRGVVAVHFLDHDAQGRLWADGLFELFQSGIGAGRIVFYPAEGEPAVVGLVFCWRGDLPLWFEE